MVLPTACFVLLLVACSGPKTTAQAQMNDVSDSEPGWFLRQLERILSNTQRIHSDGSYKKYQKNGDYHTAIADYQSLRPIDVDNRPVFYKFKGPSRVGYSEDRIIFVAKKDNIISYMTITKPNSEDIEILIRYRNTDAVRIGLFSSQRRTK